MSETKIVTIEEFQSHTEKDCLWLLVEGKVYDVSKFIDEHPGGDEVMLAEAGKDATEAFDDIGHSDEARALFPDMLVGTFEEDGQRKLNIRKPTQNTFNPRVVAEQGHNAFYIPLALVVAYFAWRLYSGSFSA